MFQGSRGKAGGSGTNSDGANRGTTDGNDQLLSRNFYYGGPLDAPDTSLSPVFRAVTPTDATASTKADNAAAGPYSLSTAQRGIPLIVFYGNNAMSDSRFHEVVAQEEERRVTRHKKLFEDLIVFEGGALSDHDSLGTSLIMQDFIHFALYHKKWGYYPKLDCKYRQFMTSGYFDPVPFGSLRNQHDYERYVGKIHNSTPACITPTQLFHSHYGWVLAEYLMTMMRAKFDPHEPLVVYDVGAGTGALAVSVLDYLAEHFSVVYAQCEYHVVEQNP
ncbi:hypothetical protein TraAM80_08094 [Trypanosoma rangeli]|uniref:Protein arginine methyltransferase NDUFAF7 n=1 Tax=Trypanosoma rangeli TaxID=5698 RepID=A0A3R7N3N9_TRYRA|nr:uncharacterized protein TraAM80_08094 [Trypanosoma rangeli]RNE99588.1 hypothetical protein TraAM80_08094 [Trypanosoma rangeli]|eukprot:RNE99588.1 hypothetical protein TraAM80_08094 [Trypanosoma rangeli]